MKPISSFKQRNGLFPAIPHNEVIYFLSRIWMTKQFHEIVSKKKIFTRIKFVCIFLVKRGGINNSISTSYLFCPHCVLEYLQIVHTHLIFRATKQHFTYTTNCWIKDEWKMFSVKIRQHKKKKGCYSPPAHCCTAPSCPWMKAH